MTTDRRLVWMRRVLTAVGAPSYIAGVMVTDGPWWAYWLLAVALGCAMGVGVAAALRLVTREKE